MHWCVCVWQHAQDSLTGNPNPSQHVVRTQLWGLFAAWSKLVCPSRWLALVHCDAHHVLSFPATGHPSFHVSTLQQKYKHHDRISFQDTCQAVSFLPALLERRLPIAQTLM